MSNVRVLSAAAAALVIGCLGVYYIEHQPKPASECAAVEFSTSYEGVLHFGLLGTEDITDSDCFGITKVGGIPFFDRIEILEGPLDNFRLITASTGLRSLRSMKADLPAGDYVMTVPKRIAEADSTDRLVICTEGSYSIGLTRHHFAHFNYSPPRATVPAGYI